ncbi:hypothetical protein GX48_05501 [Paracoccidioides brasiliensis]|nr:hypothetical protein GX48_05501 [Paracoccidioides brasiliensis]
MTQQFIHDDGASSQGEARRSESGVFRVLLKNLFLFGVVLFSSIGGLLFGYDQGAVSGVLTMESFGASFPRVYADSRFKGWFVSTLLLTAWLGALLNGTFADYVGRRLSIIVAVAIFSIGSAIQAGAVNLTMLFMGNGKTAFFSSLLPRTSVALTGRTALLHLGRAIGGFAVGQLTMVVPMYISEVSLPSIRGTLIVFHQLSITLGILLSYWIEYGSNFIGGSHCTSNMTYSGGTPDSHTFDPYHDVGPNGCDGQSDLAWRIPFGIQIPPAIILGVAMFFFPDSPRWSLMKDKDGDALNTLGRLRRKSTDNPDLVTEYLGIKASVILENSFAREYYGGLSGVKLHAAQYFSLISTRSRSKRLAIGCCMMYFQQFMGCNAMIYYAPISLLATGVYGIVNCLSTLPALFLIDRVGRRILLMYGGAGTCISLTIVGAIIGHYGSALINHQAAAWAVNRGRENPEFNSYLSCREVYAKIDKTPAPIAWVLPSEIFNASIRSKAVSITISVTWMCNFIIGLVAPKMLECITWGVYIFFAANCLLGLLFAFFFIPETRGKTLEDMDLVFGDAAAHEEQRRIMQIEAELRGTPLVAMELEKPEFKSDFVVTQERAEEGEAR